MAGRLFQTQTDAGLGMLLAQLQQPSQSASGLVSMMTLWQWPECVSTR